MSFLFSVCDVKANLFLKPFFEESQSAALRGFTMLVNEPGSPAHSFPDDYALFELAAYEPEGGSLVPHEAPKILASASAVLREVPFASPALPTQAIINDIRQAFIAQKADIDQTLTAIVARNPRKGFFARLFN